MLFTPDKLEGMFPAPGPCDSKYTRGVIGLITGTNGYPGAGVLSTSAAAMCGAGYVRASLPRESRLAVLMSHPEVVLNATSEHKPDVWVLGSGFAGLADSDERNREVRRVLELTAQRQWRVVVDAGALETFATMRDEVLTDEARSRCVITPHVGEARRLLSVLGRDVEREEIEANREKYAVNLACSLHCVVVLKGSQTVVADWSGAVYELPQATHWLATAGTGDVLAGIMGGVVALNHKRLALGEVSLTDVAAAACVVHACAAGITSLDSEDIFEWLYKEGNGESNGSAFPASMNFPLREMINHIPLALMRLRSDDYDRAVGNLGNIA